MKELVITKLHSLADAEICDRLFRDYMSWLIEELYAIHQIKITPEQEESLHTDFREEWPSMMESSGGIYLATLDGIPSGVCSLKPINDKEVELKRFYVSPESRGNGVGRQLLELALREAAQMGYQTTRLETFAFMKSAVKMYRAYGFEEVEAFEGFEGTAHGTGAIELFMVRKNY
jgi:ribosomal protein S18 acetylase RimI-like enzyme